MVIARMRLRTAEEYLAGHTIDYGHQGRGGVGLMLPEELYPNLYRAMKSNLFYIFIVPNNDRFLRLFMHIEETYYKGTKNREFAVPMRPGEPALIYITAKKYLPKEDLWNIIGTSKGESLLGPVTKEQFLNEGVDFIVLTDGNRHNDAAVILETTKFREYYITQEMR